ncbi:uncharacterized protein DUF3180 [Microcella putealis]|uniref:Uncharacterized protein DUF3180 n=1 Tax=Microcella putealis TaxID=337005 RepID=A0A4Q7LM73_9MICO|nr:DUF3180 family protein [Microcella putealis]RZS55213.1 uncharacterized protein DUF3180 [Microcella putealis]TQM23525.1 uncharacterized protein DUF3180 [Microcella putealis]
MTRTTAGPLLLLALVGAIVGFVADTLLAGQGRPVFVPPISLAIALVLIAAALLAGAWPVRRAAAGERRIDPFYATRIVVLAKASALGGALLLGAASGILIYLLSRSIVPVGSALTTGAALVGALLLLVSALVAEHFCSVPPPTDDDDQADAAPAAG